jgi:hypothetical protein
MFALAAFVSFLIALIINIVDKSGNASKYVLDFALAGGALIGLALFYGYGWKRGF